MRGLLNRVFRVEDGEWRKLLQFGLFGLLLQTGMGIGFSAGDAAFLTHVGPDKLPLVFLLTPAVMLVYTGVFSYLMVRFSIDRVVDITLAMLAVGGIVGFAALGADLPTAVEQPAYFALKLYLAVWYIALYSLFWNFTDSYFDIQDAKRLFPLFSAACALGIALGALIVSVLARYVPMHGFLLIWSGVALATWPIARHLRRRWQRIADSDTDLDHDQPKDVRSQFLVVARAFRGSRYVAMLALTLFVTLLLTNLAEFQYSTVLQAGRSEADLATLFGRLYAGSSLFNLVICLFVFAPLVSRLGVRNVALILPLTYFVTFGFFFLVGGPLAALAAFFAYHGVLTSIEYNNQNLQFNAVPSNVKRTLRTVVEGMGEPLASFVAGGFLLVAAKHLDMRELSGVGVMTAVVLIAVAVTVRAFYPSAMGANMRRGWLNFGDREAQNPQFDPEATQLLGQKTAEPDSAAAATARNLLHSRVPQPIGSAGLEAEASSATDAFAAKLDDPSPTIRKYALQSLLSVAGPADIGLVGPLVERLPRTDRQSRQTILALLGMIGDVEAIPQILNAAARLSPREVRAAETLLAGLGEGAIPRLMQGLGNYALPYRARALAARSLAALSPAQFQSQLTRLVAEELDETGPRLAEAERFEAEQAQSPAIGLLARAFREHIAASVDFVLELLALGGVLPDFDLLIVSLHSQNPKVRGNAIEAIASGVDIATFRRLEPLIHRRAAGTAAADHDIVPLLQEAVANGHEFEVAAAAQALRDLSPPEHLGTHLRAALRPGLSPMLRDTLAALLGLERQGEPTVVDLVGALLAMPRFAPASIESLTALAERASPVREGRIGAEFEAAGRPLYLTRADIDGVAARYPDLALSLLKAQDGRAYAA